MTRKSRSYRRPPSTANKTAPMSTAVGVLVTGVWDRAGRWRQRPGIGTGSGPGISGPGIRRGPGIGRGAKVRGCPGIGGDPKVRSYPGIGSDPEVWGCPGIGGGGAGGGSATAARGDQDADEYHRDAA
jgi:hypothetical protein